MPAGDAEHLARVREQPVTQDEQPDGRRVAVGCDLELADVADRRVDALRGALGVVKIAALGSTPRARDQPGRIDVTREHDAVEARPAQLRIAAERCDEQPGAPSPSRWMRWSEWTTSPAGTSENSVWSDVACAGAGIERVRVAIRSSTAISL